MAGAPPRFAVAALMALLWAAPLNALDSLDFQFASGTDESLQKSLRAASSLTAAQKEGRTSPADLYAAALSDYRSLTEALYARGHYSVVVRIAIDGREAAEIPPLSPPSEIGTITIRIDPGAPFRFGRAEIAPLAEGTKLPEGFRPDAPALAGTVTDAALAAVDGWRQKSHAKALISNDNISANHSTQRLDAALTVAPGPAVTFGSLIVEPGSSVREKRIRAIAGLPEGATFDPTQLAKAADRLRRTGTFRSVAFSEAENLNPDNSLDITASIIDEVPRRYGAGAELSTFEGLTLSGFWLHRNIFNRADRFRIEAEAAGLGGQTGGPDYSLTARFQRPAVYGPDTSFTAEIGLEHLDEPDYRSDSITLGLAASRAFSEMLTGDLGIKLTASEATDSFGTRDFRLLQFPMGLTRDTRDNLLNPSKGSYLKAALTPFRGLASTESGTRFILDARTYLPAGDRLTFAMRGQMGAVWGAALSKISPEFLFWSGGGGTVRGQPYQSLDVAVPGGTTGGRSFAALSFEARTVVTPTIGLVAFADGGYIASAPDFAGGAFHAGAGIGLRYDTPLGPLRFDVAAPVAGNTGDGMQLYIGIGQAF